jgi:hypothetical protein
MVLALAGDSTITNARPFAFGVEVLPRDEVLAVAINLSKMC